MCDFDSHSLEHVNNSSDDDSSFSESFSCETCSETFVTRSGFKVHSFQHINIAQLDGNVSVSDEPDASNHLDDESFTIPVLISSRMSSRVYQERGTCCNRSIIRDNKHLEALNLPTFTVYNMRSIWSKLDNLAEDIHERSVDISILSEVWEKKENLKHQSKIEELLEMKGISYISTPRPGLKRGGGSAIAACPKKFSLVKLHIVIPKSLEVVWGLLRPREILGKIRKIIICSFYSPPRSRKKTLLIDHILTVLDKLRTEHPGAATIISGDKNDLDLTEILSFDPAFFQIVRRPTRKDNILSIIITDLRRFYVEPIIIDPISVDENKKGSPSDHNGVLAVPLGIKEAKKGTSKDIRFVRPMPQSSIDEYRHSIGSIEWSLMLDGSSSSDMVETFQKMTCDLQDVHFPLKKVIITPYDKPWITQELKSIRRRRQRLYRREGRTQAYLELKAEFDEKLNTEAEKYMNKIREEVSCGKRGSSYSAIRKLGNREFEQPKGSETFDVPEFVEENLDIQQSAEALAEYFSSISREFQPLNIDELSPAIKDELKRGINEVKIPILEELKNLTLQFLGILKDFLLRNVL